MPIEKADNKMLFVYQSEDMQILYQRCGKHLVLLDATYKTTKYSLPLYFLVVQTNVNYQVAAANVTQEQTTCMLSKALSITKGNFSTFRCHIQFFLSFLTFFLYFRSHMILEHMFQEE